MEFLNLLLWRYNLLQYIENIRYDWKLFHSLENLQIRQKISKLSYMNLIWKHLTINVFHEHGSFHDSRRALYFIVFIQFEYVISRLVKNHLCTHTRIIIALPETAQNQKRKRRRVTSDILTTARMDRSSATVTQET